jgi:hypothetical protein
MTPHTILVAPYLYPVDCKVPRRRAPVMEQPQKRDTGHQIYRQIYRHIETYPRSTMTSIAKIMQINKDSTDCAIRRLLGHKMIYREDLMGRSFEPEPRYVYSITKGSPMH